jgi:hypothetical protein
MSQDIEHITKRLEALEERVSRIEKLLPSRAKDVGKKVSIKEFILQKHPRNDVEKTLAITYFLEKHGGFCSFNAVDVEQGFRNAREKVPSNVADKIQKNIAKGHMMEAEEEKDGRKAFVLTNSGESFVEDDFKKE